MKILLCDDHGVFRAGLRAALEQLSVEPEFLEADSARAALEIVEDERVELVCLDLRMPGMDGWEALRELRRRHPGVGVVIVSASESPAEVRTALEAGASGFVPKTSPAPVLRAAFEVVLSGGVYVPPEILGEDVARTPEGPRLSERASRLTPRQREVLVLMSRGLSNREIGDVLGIAYGTVKAHIAAVLEALDVSNRTEATLVMRELDLDGQPDDD